MAQKDRAEVRRAVHRRIRRKVAGTAERPRLAIYRSLNHIYAQVIDDERGRTLASASTTEKDLRGATGGNDRQLLFIAIAVIPRPRRLDRLRPRVGRSPDRSAAVDTKLRALDKLFSAQRTGHRNDYKG